MDSESFRPNAPSAGHRKNIGYFAVILARDILQHTRTRLGLQAFSDHFPLPHALCGYMLS